MGIAAFFYIRVEEGKHMPAIRVDNLNKSYHTRVKEAGLKASLRALVRPQYRDVEAVRDVSFEVEQGEMLAFIGPNGAGKSTTIKMMTGILQPTSGALEVLGMNPARERRLLSYRIGTVFGQKSQLWFHLPPSDSFVLLGAIYDLPPQELQRRTAELVERFELGKLMTTPVRKLSLGQRVRCEVAASLLHQPEILFLDEPTIGLDVVVKQQIRELIREMNRERGTTVFLTSHDAGDVEQLCRRALVIDRGQLVLDQPVKRLKREHFRRKVIAVRFEQCQQLQPPDGVALAKRSGPSVRLEVDTAQVGIDEAMRWVIGVGSVVDITVEDPPMEQVISDIFQHREGAGA